MSNIHATDYSNWNKLHLPMVIHTPNLIQVSASSFNIRYMFTRMLAAGTTGTNGTYWKDII